MSNSDIQKGLVDSLRWRQLDIEMKYKKIIDTALTPTTTNAQLILPEKKDMYEVSYL
ncbi:hypothetical protein H6768_06360 [Candidatus Peribacteria bacterium]|nr:hypothetical protein [Candidatus Peribacteria bacterium]